MKKTLTSNKGITLIALVVTIIILIILAGVSINLLTGPEGIITQTQTAKDNHEKAAIREKLELAVVEAKMDNAQGKVKPSDASIASVRAKLNSLGITNPSEDLVNYLAMLLDKGIITIDDIVNNTSDNKGAIIKVNGVAFTVSDANNDSNIDSITMGSDSDVTSAINTKASSINNVKNNGETANSNTKTSVINKLKDLELEKTDSNNVDKIAELIAKLIDKGIIKLDNISVETVSGTTYAVIDINGMKFKIPVGTSGEEPTIVNPTVAEVKTTAESKLNEVKGQIQGGSNDPKTQEIINKLNELGITNPSEELINFIKILIENGTITKDDISKNEDGRVVIVVKNYQFIIQNPSGNLEISDPTEPTDPVPPEKTKVTIPTLSGNNKTYTGSEQTVTVNNLDSEKIKQEGEISAKHLGTYKVTWSLNDTENCIWSDGTTEPKTATWEIEGKEPLKDIITADNYGDKVNYSVTPNGVTLNNWKIFYNDGSNVIMVYNDYLPNSTGIASNAGLATMGDYNVYSNTDRADLINKLTNQSNWTSLIRSDLAGKATAQGAVDLETWVASWNAKEYTRLYTAKKTGMNDGLDGYYVGTSANPTSYSQRVSSDEGYNNPLYFPHKEKVSNCSAYWIASPSAYDTYYVMYVNYNGQVRFNTYNDSLFGVCPAVYLKSSVLTSGKDASGAWVIE